MKLTLTLINMHVEQLQKMHCEAKEHVEKLLGDTSSALDNLDISKGLIEKAEQNYLYACSIQSAINFGEYSETGITQALKQLEKHLRCAMAQLDCASTIIYHSAFSVDGY